MTDSNELDPNRDRYVRNELGAFHRVSASHYRENLITVTPNGTEVLPAGWREATEDEVREAHPQLFGAWDQNVRLNARERKDYEALNTLVGDPAADGSTDYDPRLKAKPAAKAAPKE